VSAPDAPMSRPADTDDPGENAAASPPSDAAAPGDAAVAPPLDAAPPGDPAAPPQPHLPIGRLAQRLTVGQFVVLACFGLTLVALAEIVAGVLALHRLSGTREVHNSVVLLEWVFAVFAALLLATAAALALTLQRLIAQPLARLSGQVRQVARGRFDSPIRRGGLRDVSDLAADVDSMRRRIGRELDALREANERLDRQANELERSNAELEQFAYVASHDLREPLRKVTSFTQMLQRRYHGQLDERADEYIALAVDGAERMRTLIDDLLAFSRVGRLRETHTEVDLGEALSQALSGLAALIEETHATINAQELPTVHGEPALLSLVFQNLVGNALKFHGERRPIVSIRARRREGEWVVSCADNGIGIDPAEEERIFAIFQRLHPRERYAGTGIGLAMCRKIVEYHGGRIWLDRDVRDGATFHFTLPALDERI